MHWTAKYREKRRYAAAVYALQLSGKMPPIPFPPIARATIRAALVLGAAQDDDNAVARCKWAVDLLVQLGYLQDDRRKVLRWEGFPEQTVSRKIPHSLTLVVTPVVG